MKIKKQIEVDVDVTFPMYTQNSFRVCKILSEKKMITAEGFIDDEYCIKLTPYIIGSAVQDMQITEQEFNEKFNEVLKKITDENNSTNTQAIV